MSNRVVLIFSGEDRLSKTVDAVNAKTATLGKSFLGLGALGGAGGLAAAAGLGAAGIAVTGLGGFFQAISGAAGPASQVFGSILGLVAGLLPVLGTLVANIATGLGPVFVALVPIISQVAQVVGGALGQAFLALGPPLTQLA